MTFKMAIDVYARVSRLRDKDQTSTTSQVMVCRAALVERGLPVGKVHIDDGKSAWDPKITRPGFEALMVRLESGKADGVIVYDLERFARQLSDGERLVTAAERGLVVLDSEGEYDLRKPGDKKNFRNAIVAAEYYSDLLKVKVRRGKRAKAMGGKVDKRRSFGFMNDGVTINEPEAAILRDCAARLLAGETQDSLIRELNKTGVPSVRGAQWGYTTFRQLMLRPRNIGLLVHDGEVIGPIQSVTPIFDRLTYGRIVALYAVRKRGRQPSGRYVLTGIATCGLCGAGLAGRPVTGTPRRHYWCKKCSKISVDATRLEEWAGDFTIRALSDEATVSAIEQASHQLDERRQTLLAESAGIESTLTEIGGRLGRQEISLQRHDSICLPLEARQAEISGELETLAANAPVPLPARTIPVKDQTYLFWLNEWETGDNAARRSMLLRALNGRRPVVGPGQSARFDPSRVTLA